MSEANSKPLKLNGHGIIKLIPNRPDFDDKPYRVYGINMSDYHVTKYRVVGRSEEIVLPEPLKNTCKLDSCQECYDANKYEIFLVCQCDDPTLEIELYLKHPSNGTEGWGSPPWRIEPDCNYAGEVKCISKIELDS
jgi:hypothetical protein